MKVILHLCADIGSDSKPYQDAGYDVRLVGRDIGIENYSPPDNVYGVIANPVCTEFSIAPGFHKKGNHDEAMLMVRHCQRIITQCQPSFHVIENPASGHLERFLGKPDYVYEPWWFGDPWTKKTALWGKFNKPIALYNKWKFVPKNENLYVRPGREKPGMAFLHKSAKQYIPEFADFNVEDDMSFRSLCPQGFANAFYKENK